jgi:Ca2+-transporting ATPase
MAKRGAIVRRLGAVETLGSITVICADKTGTLTKNEMTVRRIAILPDRALDVEGLGYAPEGTIVERGRPVAALDPQLDALLTASVLCNDALLEAPATPADPWRVIGDPTEGALVVLARKAGLDEEELRRRSPRVAEQPFSSASKRMATVHRMDGKLVTYVKGAPEAVLPHCGMTDELRQRAQEVTLELASDALRVLAVARIEGVDASGGLDGLAGRMTLLGLLGQIDPPRAETKKAIEDCRAAGIRPVMITGDHAATARAIALDLGLMAEGDRTMDGRELAHASDAELDAAVTHVSVYARVEPADKLRIVGALQRAGAVVAMTGDGVNDAPALVHADVGVAMGRSGTEVAKQAAKIVVTDDDFATIVAAVREGRVVYANLRKVILLLLSTSIAEVVVLTLALLLGYPPPFFAVQILWNNLVTEGVITVNLVLDPPEGDEMARPPTPLDEPLVNRSMLRRIALMTSAIVVSTLGWFIIRVESGVPFRQAQVEAFTVLAVCEWYNVLSCRSEHRTALSSSIFRNRYLLAGLVVGNLLQVLVIFAPPMNRLFHTQPFDLAQVTVIGVVASLVLWAEEIRKFFVRRALHDR